MTKPITSEAKAAWAAFGLSAVIAVLVAGIAYGGLSAKVDAVQKDVADIKASLRERGIIAQNRTNGFTSAQN